MHRHMYIGYVQLWYFFLVLRRKPKLRICSVFTFQLNTCPEREGELTSLHVCRERHSELYLNKSTFKFYVHRDNRYISSGFKRLSPKNPHLALMYSFSTKVVYTVRYNLHTWSVLLPISYMNMHRISHSFISASLNPGRICSDAVLTTRNVKGNVYISL